MNKVILMGRLTRDPDLKATQTGKSVCNFTLAVDRNFKNSEGKREADFVPIVFWGKQADVIAQYFKKGSAIAVVGRLQTRSWETDSGERRYVTEVIGEEFRFPLTSGGNGSGEAKAGTTSDELSLDSDFRLMADDDDIPF